ncbi:hypothetical protein [Pseudoduganella chitinolytica]|uniref:Sigma-70 family RNA polymerase sigma factor n=1 Tax=Pseudoduganella chitinolytica TaxID=34070 RepID=A0ABY8BI23_9BURK|nr:hypothetical protein [Pseudoduganella chitinolytica]WEF34998.1 hypothetical protein PX653_09615 [Pseudoduganella chitinolytica]
MRLPGTRYQEHGWEGVRKLLGASSLAALRRCDLEAVLQPDRHAALLDDYTDALAPVLHAAGRSAHGPGNSYGDSIGDLAMGLLFELQARPAFWLAFAGGLAAEHAKQGAFWQGGTGDALLRKKVNDMYATLRDQVDADNYQAATGEPCSANRIYTYRMLDMAWRAIEQVFAGWPGTAAQVAAILDRPADAMPIEVRQLTSAARCRPEWVIRWSESLARFGGTPGPLHTRSKRFASLRNQPERIGALLTEIADYEALSANADGAAWLHDEHAAADWLADLERVGTQSASAASTEADRVLADPEGAGVCPAPRYDSLTAALAALAAESLPVRQAVCLKVLGPDDDSYPDDWRRGPAGGLPTLEQLALQGGMSVPTLRKRRNAAIERLNGMVPAAQGE